MTTTEPTNNDYAEAEPTDHERAAYYAETGDLGGANQRDDDPEDAITALFRPVPPEMDDYDDGLAEDSLAGWLPGEIESASWAARKLTRIRRRIDEAKRIAAAHHERIAQWEAEQTARLERDAAFFAGRLEGFHRMAIADDPRAKTIHLPDGTVLRSQAGKLAVEVTDLDALARWAEKNERAEDLINYGDPKPKLTAIAKAFAGKADAEPGTYPAVDPDSGEVVPGVQISRRDRSFTADTPLED